MGILKWLFGSSKRPLWFGGEFRDIKKERRGHRILRGEENRELRGENKELKEIKKDLKEESRALHIIRKLLKYLYRLESELEFKSRNPEEISRSLKEAERWKGLVILFTQRLEKVLELLAEDKEEEIANEEGERQLIKEEEKEFSNVIRLEERERRGVAAPLERAEEDEDRRFGKLAAAKERLEAWKESVEKKEEAIIKENEEELRKVIERFLRAKREELLSASITYIKVLEELSKKLSLLRTEDLLQRARTKWEEREDKKAKRESGKEARADKETETLVAEENKEGEREERLAA